MTTCEYCDEEGYECSYSHVSSDTGYIDGRKYLCGHHFCMFRKVFSLGSYEAIELSMMAAIVEENIERIY